MRRAILIIVLLALIVLPCLSMACDRSPTTSGVTDDLGREVNIEKTPKRVVSLAPSATEIMFALGLGSKLVGVTEACDYPAEAKEKPKVGPYYSTSFEAILDKDPDLILTDGYDPVVEQLKQQTVPMLVLQPTDVEGILNDIRLVGQVLNVESKAEELADSLQQRLDDVARKTQDVTTRPSVYYEVDASDETKPWSVGPGSLADSLIALAGGQNILHEGGAYPQINLERLLDADPDLVILGDYPYVTVGKVLARTGVWQQLAAVKNARVYAISDPSLTSRPGPRIVDGLEEMARMIHPELFPG